MDRAAFANFTRELNVHARGLTGPEVSRLLARTARQHVRDTEQRQNARSGGITPDHQFVVDGRANAAPETVRPEGAILIRWHYLTEAVIRVVDYLLDNGPERSGEWKRAITTYVDDVAVPRDAPLPAGATEAVVGVRSVYARRLEVGTREGGGAFVLQVPQHFVEQAAIAMRRVLRPLGYTTRSRWVQLDQGQGWKRAQRDASSRRARAEREEVLRFPAIVITPLRGNAL